LGAYDFLNFDHLKPAFINGLGWFFVQSIDGFRTNGTTDVTLISLDNFVRELVGEFDYRITETGIEIINKSTGFTSVKWSFGDGSSATDVNPQKKYTSPDFYPVQMFILNSDGIEESYRMLVLSHFPKMDFSLKAFSMNLATL